MARDSENYRLWEHDVEPPKKSEQTVIAKVTPDKAPPARMPASSMSAAGRVAHAAGVTPDSGLARLLDNGRIAIRQCAVAAVTWWGRLGLLVVVGLLGLGSRRRVCGGGRTMALEHVVFALRARAEQHLAESLDRRLGALQR